MVDRLRVVVVDDERSSRRAVELLLASMDDVEVVGKAADGATAAELIRSTVPDLVFLDVQMPEMDGFQVLEALGPGAIPDVVFVTAHDEFAVRAFEVNAVDYLLKPVDDRKLRRALDRARQQRGEERSDLHGLMEHFDPAEDARPAPFKRRLLVRQKGEYIFVRADDVEWIEAEGNYARLHVADGTHLIRSSLNELESTLDPGLFLRIHRSAIVNLDCITAIQPYGVSDYRAILRSGRSVNVGRTYRDALLQRQG